MIIVVTICILCCVLLIASTLFLPRLTIGRVSINTYWLVSSVGSIILLVFGLIGFDEVIGGLASKDAINPLKILILFICVTIMSIFLDETGFFGFLAIKVAKKAGKSQLRLFTAFYATISVFTVFTSNDIIILTFTPFICYFAKRARVDPLPYLISEFVAANTASMLLIIGNPTNIYLATANGIDFWQYVSVMALPTIFAAIVAYAVMLLIFYKRLRQPIEFVGEDNEIPQKFLLVVGLFFLGACTIMLAISSYIKIEMWLISACGAATLILILLVFALVKRTKPVELTRSLKRAPFELIPFVISMFILVLSLQKYKVTEQIASLLGQSNPILVYGVVSTLVANLINNIPMSVLFSAVLQNTAASISSKSVFAVIIGSNIGAFLTPISALAGIMWLNLLKQNKIEFSFLKFLKYGILIAPPTLVAALLGLLIATL